MEELKYKVGIETDRISPEELIDPGAIAALVALNEQIEQYKNELKALAEVEKQQGSLSEDQKKQQEDLKLALKDTQNEYRAVQKGIQTVDNAVKSSITTYQGLVNENKALMDAMRNLPLDDTTGELQRLQDQYNANNERLKEFDATLGNHQRNVGNYRGGLSGVSTLLRGLPAPFGAASKAVTTLNAAMKANPIGIVVAAIGLLIGILSRLEPVINLVNKATLILGETFKFVTNALSTWIDGQERNVRSLKDQIKLTNDLRIAEKLLADGKRNTIVALANTDKEIAEINKKLAEGNLFEEERNVLLLQREKRTKDLVELKRNELLLESNSLALQLEKVRGTEEEQKVRDEIAKNEAAKRQLETEELNVQTGLLNEQNAARQKAANEQQKRIEEEKQAMQSLADARTKQNEKLFDEIEKIREEEFKFLDIYIAEVDLKTETNDKLLALDRLYAKQLIENEVDRLEEQGKLVESAELQRLTRQQELEQMFRDAFLSEEEAAQRAKEQADAEYLIKLKQAKEEEVELEKLTQEAKLELAYNAASDFLAIGEGLFGKTKALAVAQAIIDTFAAANSAAKNTPGGVLAKSLAAAAMIAKGIANVRTILSTKPGTGGIGAATATSAASAMSTMAVTPAGTLVNQGMGGGMIARQVAEDFAPVGSRDRGVVVQANVDRRGLAIAVREGERSIRTQQFDFK